MPGFAAQSTLIGVFGDPHARVVTLRRRKKRRSVRAVAIGAKADTTRRFAALGMSRLLVGVFTFSSSAGGSFVPSAVPCS